MEQFGFYIAVMHPKDADGMANSADPDQTALVEQSDLGLHCLFRKPSWYSMVSRAPDKVNVGKFCYFSIKKHIVWGKIK